MKKILFPTDFSKASLNAFSYASRFAAETRAEVVTLHVYTIPPAAFMDSEYFLMEHLIIIRDAATARHKHSLGKLKKIITKLQLNSLQVSHLLREGDTVLEILDASEKGNFDYVMLGTKGATGLREVFVGTVAEKIINQSKIPVVAIPGKAKFKTIKTILFLAEIERLDMQVFEKIKSVAHAFEARIEWLQVKTSKEKDDDGRVKNWNDYFGERPIHCSIIYANAEEDAIIGFAESHHIDVMALGVHHKDLWQRLFLRSLSRDLAYHTTIPLLSVPLK